MTIPSVQYRFLLRNGEYLTVDNPHYYPDPVAIEKSEEPYVRATILIPQRSMGAVMNLCLERRGVNTSLPILPRSGLRSPPRCLLRKSSMTSTTS